MINISKISINKNYIPFILLGLGIILILLSYIFPKSTNKTDTVFNEDIFIESTQQRVELIVSQIAGVGDCSVAVNINSTIESVYVKESKSENQNSVLTTKDSSGNENAVVTKKVMPQISGVTVVCSGGNNKNVKNAVISAVSTLLDIGTNKVCVIAKAN